MEDQLISFETAKLAKEKGFDILCDAGFYNDDGKISETHLSDYSSDIIYNNREYDYSRPSQSLLQKWLRDIHGIYVESYHDYDPKDKGFQFYTNWGFHNPDTIEKKQSGWYDEYNNWKKYEDALEFGLQEALKLI